MIVVDNFLNQQDFEVFNEASKWEAGHKNTWVDRMQPKTLYFEWLSDMLWNWYGMPNSAVGFEYWTNVLNQNHKLTWHVDKDEALATEKIVKTPLFGCVLYGQHEDLSGGNLEIGINQTEVIRPAPNRVIFFDASVPHRVSEIETGTRRTFATNLWEYKIDLEPIEKLIDNYSSEILDYDNADGTGYDLSEYKEAHSK